MKSNQRVSMKNEASCVKFLRKYKFLNAFFTTSHNNEPTLLAGKLLQAGVLCCLSCFGLGSFRYQLWRRPFVVILIVHFHVIGF